MIKANELRLSNYFLYGDNFVVVSAIFKSHFNCETLNGVVIGNNIQNKFIPIPLTPELLEKCGFKKKRILSIYSDENQLNPMYFNSDLTPVIEHEGSETNPPCKYLHQLQNLTYSLTGIELDIKM